MTLEVEPELGRGSEVPGEPQSRICTYRPLAAHNAVHAGGIHADILGQPVRRYLKRLKELELQDPARVNRRVNSVSFASHGLSSSSLVVIDYLNVVGMADFAWKKHAVLLVNTNGPLALSISPQLLQSVTRPSLQILYVRGGVQHQKLGQGPLPYLRWDHSRLPAPEQPLRLLIGEALYHALILVRHVNSTKY